MEHLLTLTNTNTVMIASALILSLSTMMRSTIFTCGWKVTPKTTDSTALMNGSFLDGFSVRQMHGKVGSTHYCTNYRLYEDVSVRTSIGGYAVDGSQNIHPCGYTLTTIPHGTLYLT